MSRRYAILGKPLKLEWKRCPKGYRIEHREDRPGGGRSILDVGIIGGTFIVPNSAQLKPLVLDGPSPEKPIALPLANVLVAEDREDAIVDFASRYGLPIVHHEAEIGWFVQTADALWLAAIIARTALDDGLREVAQRLSRLPQATDHVGPDGKIFQRPRNLDAFIWAEFLSLIEAGRPFLDCDNCDEMFVGKIKREEEHHFCKPACSTKFYNPKQGSHRRVQLERIRRKVEAEIKRTRSEAEALRQQGVPSATPQEPRRYRRAG